MKRKPNKHTSLQPWQEFGLMAVTMVLYGLYKSFIGYDSFVIPGWGPFGPYSLILSPIHLILLWLGMGSMYFWKRKSVQWENHSWVKWQLRLSWIGSLWTLALFFNLRSLTIWIEIMPDIVDMIFSFGGACAIVSLSLFLYFFPATLRSGVSKSLLLLFTLSTILISPLSAQLHCPVADKQRAEKVLKYLSENTDQSLPQLVITTGKQFMGVPYVAKTLELPGEEQLVVNLHGLDCTTFLENVVALSRAAHLNQYQFDTYQKELMRLRYRKGKLAGYPSRLHYFTDWLYENEQKGLLKNITAELGGKPYPKTLNFMSTHRDSYAQLAHDDFHKAIQDTEAKLNQRPEMKYIPQAELAKLEAGIQNGDLIAITTSIKGLDVVHVGFAIRQNNRIHLFHASTRSNEVEISAEPLADYLTRSKIQTG